MDGYYGYSDDLEHDASGFMRDLSLFEVPGSSERFPANSTTPRRSDTSASEDFVKKRDVYLASLQSSRNQQQQNINDYGKILASKKCYDRNGNASSSRSVGAIESLTVPPFPPVGRLDGMGRLPLNRASVIAASKFATPRQPAAVGTHSGHSSPRSSLSSSSRESQHSSPRASVSCVPGAIACDEPGLPPPPIYANLHDVRRSSATVGHHHGNYPSYGSSAGAANVPPSYNDRYCLFCAKSLVL